MRGIIASSFRSLSLRKRDSTLLREFLFVRDYATINGYGHISSFGHLSRNNISFWDVRPEKLDENDLVKA